MKSHLVEISVFELREFINFNDEKHSLHLTNLSLVSLKLRLQFLISQNKQNTFYSFFEQFKQNEKFQENILSNITSQSNELFRDADCWVCFYNLLKQSIRSDIFNICLFEFGNFSDTITLLIFLSMNNALHKTNITVIDTINRGRTSHKFDFCKKEIETGAINFQKLSSSENLERCFIKNEHSYSFIIPANTKIQIVNSEKFKPKLQYDAVISRNLTLSYNFKAHQNIFQTYLSLMKNHSVLFIGTNENFDWCEGIDSLIKKDTTKPLFSYSRAS